MSDRTQHIAEELTSVLDYLSRVMQGIEEGDLNYLWEKTHSLTLAARRLHCTLSRSMTKEERNNLAEIGDRDRFINYSSSSVQQIVQRDARHYRAGRALYPTPVNEDARQRVSAGIEAALGGGR